jgi:branched-chain amino acid transport system substrate-binding protein
MRMIVWLERGTTVRDLSRLSALGLTSAALLAAVACTPAPAAPSTQPYQIGVVAPISGGLAFVGKVQLDALTALVNSVNNEGGIGGRKIELQAEDAQDAPASVTAFRKLDQQGVLAIYGPPISGSLEAVTQLANQLKISVITPGNTDGTLVPPQQFIFQTDAGATSDAESMVMFASSLAGGKPIKIATAQADTAAGAKWVQNVKELWGPKYSINVTSNTTLPLTAADLTPQAQSIMAGDPDMFLTEASDAGATTLIPALRQRGFTGPIILYSSTGSEPTLAKLNDPKVYAEKDIAYPGSDETAKPGVARFNSIITAAGHMDEAKNNPLYGRGYVGGLALVEAFKTCAASCTRDSLNAALNNLNVDTQGLTSAAIKLTADNHQAVGQANFWVYKDGKLQLADQKAYPSSIYDKP